MPGAGGSRGAWSTRGPLALSTPMPNAPITSTRPPRHPADAGEPRGCAGPVCIPRASVATELRLCLLIHGGSLRSASAARPPGRPALRSPPRSSPAGVRAARSAIGRLMLEKGYAVAGAARSKALRTHLARASKITTPASCSPGRPAGSQRAGGLRGLITPAEAAPARAATPALLALTAAVLVHT